MPQYKLTYFNARGRAELIRWILKVSDVDFEDFRIPKGGWTNLKPSAPFGQVPTLEIDGNVHCQSLPLCRHLANEYGLGGMTLADQARIDMIVDCCDDLGTPASVIFQETDKDKKEQLLRLFREEQLPTFMKYFEKIQTQNRCGQGWFVGEEMTWADLAFVVYTTSWLEGIDVTPVWADYPLLAAIKDKVEALPQLEKWFKQRPRTSF